MTSRPHAQATRGRGETIAAPHAPYSSLAGSGASGRVGVLSPDPKHDAERLAGVQWIVLEDFPDTLTARTLSPNGRAHWGSKQRATEKVQHHVWLALLEHEPWPVQAPAEVLYRWVMPARRKRDLDNHGTGVIKVIQDSLVRHGILPGGDHAEALTSRVEIVVQKHRRAMEIGLSRAARPSGDGHGEGE